MKVLIVDDSRTMRNLLKNTLNAAGFGPFLEAADGMEALTALQADRPDLIFLDWNMPNMDGITVLRRVRESDKQTPIVMVTTEAEKTRVIEAIKAGATNYLIKPFTPDLLLEKARKALAQAQGSTLTGSAACADTGSAP